jgi:hypothetical protein
MRLRHEPVLARLLRDIGGGLSGRRVNYVARHLLVARRTLAVEETFQVDRVPEIAIGERAAETFIQQLLFRFRYALDDTAHAVGSQLVRVVFGFDQYELPICFLSDVQIKDGVSGAARPRK